MFKDVFQNCILEKVFSKKIVFFQYFHCRSEATEFPTNSSELCSFFTHRDIDIWVHNLSFQY